MIIIIIIVIIIIFIMIIESSTDFTASLDIKIFGKFKLFYDSVNPCKQGIRIVFSFQL